MIGASDGPSISDLFCGGGGSSIGAWAAGGRLALAINHDPSCVETHNHNFPDADHDCIDISHAHPGRYPRTDILIASPSCTFHSRARGKKMYSDEADRSRATMWDVPRFAEYHKYDAVIVENVIEAAKWAPFPAWLWSMRTLGYRYECKFLNSQFFGGVPQSRDRMYVVFWRDGAAKPDLNFLLASWCVGCDGVVPAMQVFKRPTKVWPLPEWGRYGTQYLYHCVQCGQPAAPAVAPALAALDVDDLGGRIGERQRPLAPNTMRRIKRGVDYLGSVQPMAVAVGGNLYERPGSKYARVWSLHGPLPTVHGTLDKAIVVPNMMNCVAKTIDEPIGAVTTGGRHMLVRAGGQSESPRHGDEPAMTLTAHDRQVGLLGGAVVPMRKASPKTLEETINTVCASGGHHALVTHPEAAIVYNGVPGFVRDASDCAGAVTTRDKQALLGLTCKTGGRGKAEARSIEQPVSTATCRDKDALVGVPPSMLAPYYGTGVAAPSELPSGALTTKDRRALVSTADLVIEDCTFRMVKVSEIARFMGMAHRPDGTPYELRSPDGKPLTEEAQTKMYGNACTPPVIQALVGAAIESIS